MIIIAGDTLVRIYYIISFKICVINHMENNLELRHLQDNKINLKGKKKLIIIITIIVRTKGSCHDNDSMLKGSI